MPTVIQLFQSSVTAMLNFPYSGIASPVDVEELELVAQDPLIFAE